MNLKTKKTLLPIITILILITLIILAIYIINLREYNESSDEGIYVSKVIDGDTFKMSDDATIRLLCVDAPEKGKTGYKEAKDFLADMILDKQVRLEKDITDKDAYGRLLRYVYVNISNTEIFVNQQVVQEDYAKIFRYGNDTAKCDEIAGLFIFIFTLLRQDSQYSNLFKTFHYKTLIL